MMKREEKKEVITASEISQYAFCPLSWHLARAGIKPRSPGLIKGDRAHQKMGKELSILQKKEDASRTLGILGHLSALGALLLLGWFLFSQL